MTSPQLANLLASACDRYSLRPRARSTLARESAGAGHAGVDLGDKALAASIGASVSRNYIGYQLDGTRDTDEVRAYLNNTPVSAGGDLTLDAKASTMKITAGVGALTLGLVEGGDWGWASGKTIGLFVAAIVLEYKGYRYDG